MPSNDLIAFGTFYSQDLSEKSKPSSQNAFDCVYKKETSVLTRLRFKLKKCVKHREPYKEEFNLTLYPNSLFIIPLSTNRLYSHEIVPSHLPIDKIPTRLGYVIRCSKTKAVHREGMTYIKENDKDVKLEILTDSDRELLQSLYFEENMTDDIIEYPTFYFSVNSGDYLDPSI